MKRIRHIFAKTPLLLRVVSLYVVVISSAGLYWYSAPSAQAPQGVVYMAPVVVEKAPEVTVPERKAGVPRSIELPRIGLMREVIDGYYDVAAQDWTLTDDKAQYATMTTPINDEAGQTMIYGHNTSAVLEPVRLLVPGDELVITTDSGHTFLYTYSHDRFVVPTDVSVLYEASETPRVVLMTCEGWFSTTRRLLYFDFKEAV